jgi:opacity protein-like surface antigen
MRRVLLLVVAVMLVVSVSSAVASAVQTVDPGIGRTEVSWVDLREAVRPTPYSGWGGGMGRGTNVYAF